MKKMILLFLVLVMALCILAGCGSSKTGTCEECGQTEKQTRFIEEDGTVHWLCNDCYRMAKMFGY